jgi:hypothetical protein
MMNIPVLKLTLIGGVYASVLFTALFWRFADEKPIWEWLLQVAATLIGTILAVAVGLWLFHHQARKTDEAREEQLLTTLAGETQANLNILSGQPSRFESSDGTIDCVVLIRLGFLVAEEAVRSGVFTSDEARLLSELISNLQVHNDEVHSIKSTRTGLTSTGVVQGEATGYMIEELKLRQEDIRTRSERLLKYLEEADIKVPSTPD